MSDMDQRIQEYIERNEPVSLSDLESNFGDTASGEALRLVDKNKVSINANWEYTAIHCSVGTGKER